MEKPAHFKAKRKYLLFTAALLQDGGNYYTRGFFYLPGSNFMFTPLAPLEPFPEERKKQFYKLPDVPLVFVPAELLKHDKETEYEVYPAIRRFFTSAKSRNEEPLQVPISLGTLHYLNHYGQHVKQHISNQVKDHQVWLTISKVEKILLDATADFREVLQKESPYTYGKLLKAPLPVGPVFVDSGFELYLDNLRRRFERGYYYHDKKPVGKG